jgi:hypothetical protein
VGPRFVGQARPIRAGARRLSGPRVQAQEAVELPAQTGQPSWCLESLRVAPVVRFPSQQIYPRPLHLRTVCSRGHRSGRGFGVAGARRPPDAPLPGPRVKPQAGSPRDRRAPRPAGGAGKSRASSREVGAGRVEWASSLSVGAASGSLNPAWWRCVTGSESRAAPPHAGGWGGRGRVSTGVRAGRSWPVPA